MSASLDAKFRVGTTRLFNENHALPPVNFTRLKFDVSHGRGGTAAKVLVIKSATELVPKRELSAI